MTIFGKIKNWLEKAFKSAPHWEKLAAGTLEVAAPILEETLELIGPAGQAVEPAVARVISEIQKDMAIVATTATAAGPSPTAITSLQAIQANLKELLSVAQVKDPAVQQKYDVGINTLLSEVEAMLTFAGVK